MLQAIRDKATGWLAYVIIGLIAVPFALWGLGEYFGGAGPLVAAEVNGTEIPVRIVHQETRAQRDQLAQMFGGQIPADLFDERALRDAALESLIQQELLRQAAEKAGFRAAESGVVREIQSISVFWENGQFNPDRYHTLLQSQRITPGEFERDVAQSIKMAQIQQAIQATGDWPPAKVETYARLRNQVRVASWALVDAAAFDSADVVEDAVVEAYYQANPERFTTEERLRVAYLQLDPRAVESDVTLREEDVREHFEVNIQRYTDPELRRVRQILISTTTPDAESLARTLRERLDAGETFADLARDYSTDSLSADRGGDMGQIARGDLDRVLETVIFSLPTDLVSQPVQSARGWHILEVTDIQPAQAQPFASVRDEVERDLRDRRAEQRQIQILDDLLSQTFENPDSLTPAARVTGLEIRESDWFTRANGSGVAAVRGVREAAFSAAVLVDGRNSEAVDLPDGSTLVLRKLERQPPSVRPLEEVADSIRETLRQDAAAVAAQTTAETLRERLQAGESLTELRDADPSLAWALSVEVPRQGQVDTETPLPEALRERLFRMTAPATDTPAMDVLRLPNGDAALVILEAVRSVALAEEESDAALRRAAQSLQMNQAAEEMQAYLAWLESEAKIRRHPQNLE